MFLFVVKKKKQLIFRPKKNWGQKISSLDSPKRNFVEKILNSDEIVFSQKKPSYMYSESPETHFGLKKKSEEEKNYF